MLWYIPEKLHGFYALDTIEMFTFFLLVRIFIFASLNREAHSKRNIIFSMENSLMDVCIRSLLAVKRHEFVDGSGAQGQHSVMIFEG